MACKSAGPFDEDTGRWDCQATGDECMYYFPNSKRCAEEYNEGPDAVHGDGNDEIMKRIDES